MHGEHLERESIPTPTAGVVGWAAGEHRTVVRNLPREKLRRCARSDHTYGHGCRRSWILFLALLAATGLEAGKLAAPPFFCDETGQPSEHGPNEIFPGSETAAPSTSGERKFFRPARILPSPVADRGISRNRDAVRAASVATLLAFIALSYLLSSRLAAYISRFFRTPADSAVLIIPGAQTGSREDDSEHRLLERPRACAVVPANPSPCRSWKPCPVPRPSETSDEIERRVAERTAALIEANRRLQQEIERRAKVEEALEKAAATDYLTGLANRRAVVAIIQHEIARYSRTNRPFSLLLMDLDRFKLINDLLGHQTGDEVLVNLAALFRAEVRSQDVVARWGGDELLVFMPETTIYEAIEAAERLRALVGTARVPLADHRLKLSASIGVFTVTPGASLDECVHRADLALLRAKHQGRDQVVALSSEEMTPNPIKTGGPDRIRLVPGPVAGIHLCIGGGENPWSLSRGYLVRKKRGCRSPSIRSRVRSIS